MRVSIVIPAYNEERHLAACLDAIMAQTVRPFEVIVVDNNSTDKTAAIARCYPLARVVHEAKQGIVYARNAGFDAARGEIIGRIDAEVILPKNWVEHIQAFYDDERHSNQAWTGMATFYNMYFPRLAGWVYWLLAYGLGRMLMGHYTLWGSNMALPRSLWRAVRGQVHLRTDIHEDLDLSIHLHHAGYSIVYDGGVNVRASLRRIRSDRHKLWSYLQWWPRTLRLHGYKTWVIAWFFGALMLYVLSYIIVLIDWFRPMVGLKKRPETF
ncbi:MAG TPA: glycosyltransferase family A protein [Candidatus Saccharimonadales bacterium]|nr:glycosyltransferase family A protein [Candidatus Saccharimonadales bacterium]